MPRFKKAIRKAGGGPDYGAAARDQANYILGKGPYAGGPETEEGIMRGGLSRVLASRLPRVPSAADLSTYGSDRTGEGAEYYPSVVSPKISNQPAPRRVTGMPTRQAPMPPKRAPIPNFLDRDMDAFAKMTAANPELMKTMAEGFPVLPTSSKGGEGEEQELESLKKTGGASSAAAAIPKTKAGMKKFMQDYGKFIALGAMAGAGGKGGQIAAPIMAALPGLIEMMKSKKKSSGGEPPKKSEGGAIRKFKGGSMKGNSMDSMLTPKYAKGGKTDKMGKAAGEMPQHKKMAMGKPTPQSTGQKFAKGGAAKYAGGGMCKGYGISKKIRPTGPMN